MYIRRNIRLNIIFRFAWWRLIVFSVWSFVALQIHAYFRLQEVDCSLPLGPLGTIGVAVAFYIGFKNSQSYDRFWEARKIWGGIVNVSRSWANQVLSFVSDAHTDEQVPDELVRDAREKLIYRHMAWMNSLRFQLRRETSFGYKPKGTARHFLQATDVETMRKELAQFLPNEDLSNMCSAYANPATQLLRQQGEHLRTLIEKQNLIEDFRFIALMDLITEMHSLQGKCERIKNTPFPRQYAYFSAVFTWIFIILLPFGLVGEMASRGPSMVWLTIPLSVVISWIFYTMETVGDASEDPFENFINDVPMTALCRTIEIDLRQMLGETDLPEPIKPVNDILM